MSGQRDQARRAELEHMLLNLRIEHRFEFLDFADYIWHLVRSPDVRGYDEAIELLNLYDRINP